jgi:phosphoglycolate phosphatase
MAIAETLPQYRAHHPSVMRRMTRLLPGAATAICGLRRAGIRLGVCSNKPAFFTRQLLGFLELANDIEVVVGPEDVPRPKPAPEMLLLALKRLQVAAAATLYVGDMVVDIECARAAGLPVWVVPTGSQALAELERAGPDAILADLHELLPRLQLS